MKTLTAMVRKQQKSLGIPVFLAGAAVIAAMLPQLSGSAQGPVAQQSGREVIPGADRMSGAEREAYRRRMQAAATPEEKAKIRAEYAKTTTPEVPKPLVGDPQRGSNLHRACFSCHGVERYTQPVTAVMASFTDSLLRASGLSDLPPAEPTRFKGRIQSLVALRDAVVRRNDFFNPKMTPQEIEDVVAYLNASYYKFPQ
jgi:hypothetical protein